MLTDPQLDLQAAIYRRLAGSARLKSAIAGEDGVGVYDRIPRDPDGRISAKFPFVGFGDMQTLPELGESTDAAQTTLTLHVYSREVGFPEARRIAAACIAELHDADIELADGTLQSLLLESSRILRDPDGLTSHAVITFTALTDAN